MAGTMCSILTCQAALAIAAGSAAAVPGYPTFADLGGESYSVTYDKRALQINGKPSLFVSGAIHPPRGTPAMWKTWLAEAKANGLNMVQVYIFWNYHEPLEGQFDFSGRGNLTLFMQEATAAGIFVNLRIGPYVCAEWTYGGLPAWLGQKPGVAFRQSNAVWQPAMESWFNKVVDLMAAGKFFANQGGPIVLVQVENELPSTDGKYVQWCGDMAHAALAKVGVDVPITMCNGETADNAINTCNGNDCSSFLEHNGQNGRVLKDQPGLWTENEGGFQTWGGAPPPGREPYFWGRPIADQALSVMKWFARGGSHMNYYMWTGGNNYGRWTGDAITHMYAVDAIVCPDGLRHEPKFSHTTAMHNAIATAAAEIASNPAQLDNATKLGNGVQMFKYGSVAFLESNSWKDSTVTANGHSYTVTAGASLLVNLETGAVMFDSKTLSSQSLNTPRRAVKDITTLTNWSTWSEPVKSESVNPGMYPASSLFQSPTPIEMTNLTSALTTFAFYEVEVPATLDLQGSTLSIPTVNAQAFVAFVDGKPVGSVDDHTHGNGASKTLELPLDAPNPANAPATRTLTLLAEELGYANYGFKTELFKGIYGGSVKIDGAPVGGAWKMRGGLAGEHMDIMSMKGQSNVSWATSVGSNILPGTWLQTRFVTPDGVGDGVDASQLLLRITGLGRGRFWLNGIDVGRYWTLARNNGNQCPDGESQCPTQQYYHIPAAWLSTTGDNLLTIFESLGGSNMKVSLSLATMQGSGGHVDSTVVTSCTM